MSKFSSGEAIILYCKVDTALKSCSLGYEHSVDLYTKKIVKPTGRSWEANNGYETTIQPIYEDWQGREYKKMVSIDYSNNVYYLRKEANGLFSFWYPRLPKMGRLIFG